MKALNSLHNIYCQLKYIMSKKQKSKAILLAFIVMIGSIFETLSVSIIIPFIEAIMDTTTLMKNQSVHKIIETFNLGEKEIIWWTAIAIIIVYIIKNTFLLVSSYAQTRFRCRTIKDISVKMLKSYLNHPYTYFFDVNSGKVIRGIYDDVGGLFFILEDLFRGFGEITTTLFIGITLLVIEPFLALGLLLLLTCVFAIIIFGIKKQTGHLGEELRDANAFLHQYVLQMVGAVKEIMINQKREYFINEYTKAYEKRRKVETKYSFIGACPERIIEMSCICGLIIMVTVRVSYGVDEITFVSKMGAFAIAAFRILPSMSRIAGYINNLIYYTPMLEATYNNMREAEEYTTKINNRIEKQSDLCGKFNSELIIDNVNWSYGEKQILKNVTLKIKRGESVALVGASGAGKTTLADIILALLIPRVGDVKKDGISIYSDLKGWSDLLAYVPQNVFLFDDSIRNNIAFGVEQESIDDERVWRVLEQAQLAGFVKDLPEQLDTIVGERGIKFSGGQKQRIAIARALYRKPEILVLDEATSALDNDTESAVMSAIDSLQGKLTMIIVAHRLSTVKKCDKIYEVGKSQVVLKEKNEIMKNI